MQSIFLLIQLFFFMFHQHNSNTPMFAYIILWHICQCGLPAMPRAWPDFFRGIRAADDGYSANLPGAPAEEVGITRVRSGGHSGVDTDTSSEPARHGSGGPGRGTPPPPPGGIKLTGYLSRNIYCSYGAQWRVAWQGHQIVPTYVLTLRTSTRGTQQ